MSTVRINHLIKFGSEEHMTALLKQGVVYLNTIEYFRTLEEDSYRRGDSYEGTISLTNMKDASVYIETDTGSKLLGEASIVSTRHFKEDIKGNLYCLYAIHPETIQNGTFTFRDEIAAFGSHCIWINEGQNEEFCRRIVNALKSAGYNTNQFGLVDYYDPELRQFIQVGIMKKRLGFSFQNEFRFFVHNDQQKPIMLNIGSIEDIATIIETKSILGKNYYSKDT